MVKINSESMQLEARKPEILEKKITINKIIITKHFLKRLIERVYRKTTNYVTEEEVEEIAGLINDMTGKYSVLPAKNSNYKDSESLLIPFYCRDNKKLFYILGIYKNGTYTTTTIVNSERTINFNVLVFLSKDIQIESKKSLGKLGKEIGKILKCYRIDPEEFLQQSI